MNNTGFFSKSRKPDPKIAFEGIEFVFHRDYDVWEFIYRGMAFFSSTPTLMVPAKAELEFIVSMVESLMPEMRERLANSLAGWGEGCNVDDGESFSINFDEFSTDKFVHVSFSDGDSWGDLEVNFTIKDHTIIDETWGD